MIESTRTCFIKWKVLLPMVHISQKKNQKKKAASNKYNDSCYQGMLEHRRPMRHTENWYGPISYTGTKPV